jgi:hypothetical protein
MFASAGAELSKTDQSRVLSRKVDLRARNTERLGSLGAGVRHFSHVLGCKVCIPVPDALNHSQHLFNVTLWHCQIPFVQFVKLREQRVPFSAPLALPG